MYSSPPLSTNHTIYAFCIFTAGRSPSIEAGIGFFKAVEPELINFISCYAGILDNLIGVVESTTSIMDAI